eukprot:2351915-Rhodomonas_salina.1
MERAGDGGLEALKWKKGNGLRGRRKNLKRGEEHGEKEVRRGQIRREPEAPGGNSLGQEFELARRPKDQGMGTCRWPDDSGCGGKLMQLSAAFHGSPGIPGDPARLLDAASFCVCLEMAARGKKDGGGQVGSNPATQRRQCHRSVATEHYHRTMLDLTSVLPSSDFPESHHFSWRGTRVLACRGDKTFEQRALALEFQQLISNVEHKVENVYYNLNWLSKLSPWRQTGKFAIWMLTTRKALPRQADHKMRKWFKKIGHKGAQPVGFRFSVQVQKMSKCNCHNMPLFVMWKRTRRRQGRTKVEWEEDSEVSWTNEKLTIPATLFMEEIEGEKKFQSKSIRLSVMKHLRNNKSTEMGYLNMELTDYIHYEEPKMFKIELEGGEFEGEVQSHLPAGTDTAHAHQAILRCVISARMTGKGEEESDEDEDEDDEEEAAKNIDEDQDEDEDEDDENSQKKKGPVVRTDLENETADATGRGSIGRGNRSQGWWLEVGSARGMEGEEAREHHAAR